MNDNVPLVSQIPLLQSEWTTLQNQYDSYEKCSLLIKLLNVMVTCVLVFFTTSACESLIPIAILWLQDAIWKTFQGRIGERILAVEAALTAENDAPAMQFNRAWLANRKGSIGLIAEYIIHAVKPTVAYPHIVLCVFAGYMIYMGQ